MWIIVIAAYLIGVGFALWITWEPPFPDDLVAALPADDRKGGGNTASIIISVLWPVIAAMVLSSLVCG